MATSAAIVYELNLRLVLCFFTVCVAINDNIAGGNKRRFLV